MRRRALRARCADDASSWLHNSSAFQGSTPTIGACANWDEEVTNEERNRAINILAKRWNATQVSALSQLRTAAETYFHRHASNELNKAGTARAVEAIGELGKCREAFRSSLTSYERGDLPNASPADLTKAEALLNRIYRRVLTSAEEHKTEYGAVQPEGVRETEREWLRYRDAWLAFAKVRYPSVRVGSWQTFLDKERIVTLQDTLSEIGY